MRLKRNSLCALIGSLLLLACNRIDENSADRFSYSNFDSEKSLQDNLQNLNDVSEDFSDNSEQFAVGLDPDSNTRINLTADHGNMIGIRVVSEEYFEPGDYKTISEYEKRFNINTKDRTIKSGCDTFKGAQCTYVYYFCSKNKELKRCPISVLSFLWNGNKSTSIEWKRTSSISP